MGLPRIFYTMPRYASATMASKELRDALLETGGQVMACGSLYEIDAKPLGAGVYLVRLKPWTYSKAASR